MSLPYEAYNGDHPWLLQHKWLLQLRATQSTRKRIPMTLRDPVSFIHPTEAIVGQAPAVQALRAQIRHLAAFDTSGMPLCPPCSPGRNRHRQGAGGAGHPRQRPARPGPLHRVNCAAIPETLLEAELFGFEAGAFTDAKRAKPGLFEAASGGTLFLDEIDALPLPLQGKLLTAIEAQARAAAGGGGGAPGGCEADRRHPGGPQAEAVAAGRFRADLYHRLAVVVLELPPLRARGDDILVLAQHFLHQYAEAHGVRPSG